MEGQWWSLFTSTVTTLGPEHEAHLSDMQQLSSGAISLCSAKLSTFVMVFRRYFFLISHLASPVQMQISMNWILHGLGTDKFIQVRF